MVGPITERAHFDQLLASRPTAAERAIPQHLRVKPEEWESWAEGSTPSGFPAETLTIVHLIRDSWRAPRGTPGYVSDRRWQRAAMLMKASAFSTGVKKPTMRDAILLKHCLWTHDDNRQAVVDIVGEAVKACGFDSGVDLAEIDRSKDKLDKEINDELFHSSDVYETKKSKRQQFFRFQVRFPVYQHDRTNPACP